MKIIFGPDDCDVMLRDKHNTVYVYISNVCSTQAVKSFHAPVISTVHVADKPDLLKTNQKWPQLKSIGGGGGAQFGRSMSSLCPII